MALQITILSLNVWGIPFVSNDRQTRMRAIAEAIKKSFNNGNVFDVVSLQEVWSEYDYNLIKEETECVLPYSHYFYSGVMGAGLCILSKHPIVSVFFHAWSVNGYFHRIQHADWFGGKGLHAEYDNENDEYKTHRVIQAFDTAQFIRNTIGDSVLQILAGDLNTQPHDVSYKTLLRSSEMIDCCTDDNVGTNECIRNSYSTPSIVKNNPVGLRIDHIFASSSNKYQINVDEYKLPLPERVPGEVFSYSDHEAISAKISITNKTNCSTEDYQILNGGFCASDSLLEDEKKFLQIEAIQECVELCENSLKKLKTDRILYYSIAIFLTFLLICIIDYDVPYGFKILYLFLKFAIFAIILFSIFMASLWNFIERNGILSGKYSMEIYLKTLENFQKYVD